jgi:hypothetical protein
MHTYMVMNEDGTRFRRKDMIAAAKELLRRKSMQHPAYDDVRKFSISLFQKGIPRARGMTEAAQAKSALCWMRKQAGLVDSSVGGKAHVSDCARILSDALTKTTCMYI